MYAVIEVGSFQFKVQEGEIIDTPSLPGEAGCVDHFTFLDFELEGTHFDDCVHAH
jgi:ribosomal protein L21